jgi:hypothetical protein
VNGAGAETVGSSSLGSKAETEAALSRAVDFR